MTEERKKFQESLEKYGDVKKYPDRENVILNAKMMERKLKEDEEKKQKEER